MKLMARPPTNEKNTLKEWIGKVYLKKLISPTGGNRIKKPCRSVEGRKPDCARDMKKKC
jgi:hypothetical protein